MSRLIEIHDHQGKRSFSEADLPLAVGSSPDAHIRLPSGVEFQAHIATSRGHFFLQTVDDTGKHLYHNNKKLQGSVWIKSGDRTRFNEEVVDYVISGDLVTIRVSKLEEPTVTEPLAPPTPEQPSGSAPLPKISQTVKVSPGKNKLRLFIGLFLFFTALAALFLLIAHPVEITTNPTADSKSLKGFPPPIKMGDRYLALSGSYRLTAQKDGYSPLTETLKVSSEGGNQFTYMLHKLPGLVSINTPGVIDAEVIIDNISMGTTPLIDLEVEAGERLLRINKSRYLPYEKKITINGSGERQSFECNPLPGWAKVHLLSEPPGALVREGDRELGTTPVTIELMGGGHSLLFEKNDFTSKSLELDVVAGQTLQPAPVQLTPSPATLVLNTEPNGALLLIDQEYRGRSPLEVSLSSGEQHLLKLYSPGRETVNKTVQAAPNEVRTININLKAEYGNIFLFTEPADARLFIDGKEHGPALGRLRLPTRSHIFEVKAPGHTTKRETITPTKEYDQRVEIKLLPEKAALSSTPGSKKLTNGEGIQLIRLSPTVFTMGSSRREPGRRANEAQRKIRITRPFLLAANEVSNAEFRRYKPDHSSGSFQGRSLDDNKQPAVKINWEDATRYCNWLSKQEGLQPFYVEKNNTMVPAEPVTNGYRLPFEAEWAYAARKAAREQEARYGWVGDYPPKQVSGNYGDLSARNLLNVVINSYNDSFAVSAPVGSFAPNEAGFYDLGGNVSEWCHDFYSSTLDGGEGELIDPIGPSTGTHHVVRGASWRDASITELRLSYRGYSREPLDDIGFRVARYE